MKFYKYQALGNDYIVLDPADTWAEPSISQIRRICDRHRGVGSDGVLFGPIPQTDGAIPAPDEFEKFAVRIFNPDGSLAEISGNGLRIFARHLWEKGKVGKNPFILFPGTRNVIAQLADDGRNITLGLGPASFRSQDIPMSGPPRLVLDETLTLDNERLSICAINLGNPHCVVLLGAPPSPALAHNLGPQIEKHPFFPQRTNVQFLYVTDPQNVQVEIWERGAGYTLASGSSSAAAAAAAYRLGLCQAQVAVHMPGGVIQVSLQAGATADTLGGVQISGPVSPICSGEFDPDFFRLTL